MEDCSIKPSSALPATLSCSYLESPVGPLLVAGDETGLFCISFATSRRRVEPKEGWRKNDSLFKETSAQLDAYFAGELTRFDLPLQFVGTAFQRASGRR